MSEFQMNLYGKAERVDGVERMANHVRDRHDKKRDTWEYQHREEKGLEQAYMNDTDAFQCAVEFRRDSEERSFTEYVPRTIRIGSIYEERFGFVAVFDRKTSVEAAFHHRGLLSRKVQCYACRKMGKGQPVATRFFYSVGMSSPWLLIEIDTRTCLEIARWHYKDGEWRALWTDIGLLAARSPIYQWLPKEVL